MTEPTHTPEPTSVPQATLPTPADPVATPAPRAPKRSRSRTALIAGGAALTGLILAGGGIAVGAAIADDLGDDDHDDTASTIEEEADDVTNRASSTTYGAESSREVHAVIAAAAGIAEGDAVGLDADQDGTWEVDLRRSTGDETLVRVDSNGAAAIISAEPTEPGEETPNGVLDRDTIDAVVEAAVREADGTIVEIEVDDDRVAPYEVSILSSERGTVTLHVDADFNIVDTASED